MKNQLQFYQLTIAVSVSNLHELVNNSTPISKYNSNKSRISKFSICQEAGGGGGGSQVVTVSMFTLERRLEVVGVTVRSVVVVECLCVVDVAVLCNILTVLCDCVSVPL